MVARLTHTAGAVLACLLAASCSSNGGTGSSARTPTHRPPVSASETSPDSPPGATRTEPEPVTLAFGGDVHFESEIAARLERSPQTTLGPIAKQLSAADVAMVNLETAVTTEGSAAPKTYTFRAPPVAFDALSAAGVDVATMANNHSLDYGKEGLRDSLVAANDHNFPVVGIGRDAAQAYAPHIVTVREQRVGFIGATQVLDSHLVDEWTAGVDEPGLASAKKIDRLATSVRATREKVDTLVVYVHWGRSLEKCPLDRQRDLARRLIDAGADVIVGTHAHRLLAGGLLRGRYVHYGLGNFVWYNADGPSGRTGVLTLALRGREVQKAKWTSATISGGIPRVLHGAAAERALERWQNLRECTRVTPAPSGMGNAS